MSKPMPDHGTRARYLRGCHCDPCCQAHRTYCKSWKNVTYRTGSLLVDAAPYTAMIRERNEVGWTYRQIADAVGASKTFISDLGSGRRKTLHRDRARKLAAFHRTQPLSHAPRYVSAVGTARRIQALATMGHSIDSIARAVGLSRASLSKIANGSNSEVQPETAQSIAALYKRWSRIPGSSNLAKGWARRHQWHGPLAWGDIDDPEAKPELAPLSPVLPVNKRELVQKRAEQRRAEILHLTSLRLSPQEIAAQTGLSTGYVCAQIKGERKPGWRKEKKEAAA